MRLFIAEKPSLARAIAEALPGPARRRDGYLECPKGDVVAWCAGHILELAPPEAYDRSFKQWRVEDLPITPREWKLSVTAPGLLRTVKALLSRADVVVNAGDPDREGQLLVDEVIEYLGYRGPVHRLLVNDLNTSAVRKAIGAIESNAKYRRLYEAALGRQRADWLFGLNMTRLYTVLGRHVGYDGVLSVGRVQTPLLGLIVRRDQEIETFVPKPYYEVVAELTGAGHPFSAKWRPHPDLEHVLDSEGRLINASVAADVERRTRGQLASVTRASRDRKKEAPPLPFSLPELQIEAGRRLDLNPKQTLDVCQSLYETHRLITYPRSDCSYLPTAHLGDVPDVMRAMASIEPSLEALVGEVDPALRSRAWNDSKVSAHHAIIPTPNVGSLPTLSGSEHAIYDLVARRYLAQFFPPFEYHHVEAEVMVAGERFVARGTEPIVDGWKRVLGSSTNDDRPDDAGESEEMPFAPIPPLSVGQALRVANTRTVEKKTRPPRRFTSATLVQAMTRISMFVSRPEIRKLLKETDGIGTPATQASIVETLFDRGYIEERQRQVVATETGRALIQALPDVATQPDMTALWEAALRRIQEGRAPLEEFLAAVTSQLTELIRAARAAGPLQMPPAPTRPCPRAGCAGPLRRRAGQRGPFWECSRYPDCDYTTDITSSRKSFRPARRTRGRRKGTDPHAPAGEE
jgi:DNA topoisomerase-3